MSPTYLYPINRQYNIAKYAYIASRAVAVALECNESASKAIQVLELGRGVLGNLQLEVRSDISALEAAHPEIADHVRTDIGDRPCWTMPLSGPSLLQNATSTSRQSD